MVRIVCGPSYIGAQIFEMRKPAADVILVAAFATARVFFMHADAAQL